ncbi:MAG: methyltransferase domain-containing protein, partial [Alphaproteobacteria bacterium]|nr:methyltransferase domain-containing protein [Alphaproteobacteria bacterium]
MIDIHRVYRVFQDYFRPKRLRQFVEICNVKGGDHILDIGGSPLNWSYISIMPKITIGNISETDRNEGRFSYRNLDGTKLPFADESFEIAYSNSVIEHVGDWDKKQQFAKEIRRVAKKYYVQTPNRWFFIEPHFISPFIHYLPRPAYRRLLPFCSLWYWITRPTRQEANELFDEIGLLNES